MKKARPYKWLISVTVLASIVVFLVTNSHRELIPEIYRASHPTGTISNITISNAASANQKAQQNSNNTTRSFASARCPPNQNVLTPSQSINPELKATPYQDSQMSPGAAVGISFGEDLQIDTYPPSDLRAIRLLDGNIKCEWSHSGTLIKHFNIYRKDDTDNWIKIGSVDKNSMHKYSYIDSLAHKDKSYHYSISTVNSLGEESSCSQPIAVSVL